MATKKNTTSNFSWILLGAVLLSPLVFKKNPIASKRIALINTANSKADTQSEKDKATLFFNKLTDSEINLLYDVQVANKYEANLPESIKAQIKAISDKYGFR